MRLQARGDKASPGATGSSAVPIGCDARRRTTTKRKKKKRKKKNGNDESTTASLECSVTALHERTAAAAAAISSGRKSQVAAHHRNTALRSSFSHPSFSSSSWSSSWSSSSSSWSLRQQLLLVLHLLATLLLTAMASEKSSSSGARHFYNEYSWELNQLNPWLSACDLAGPAPADLQGGCQGAREQPRVCPAECSTRRDRAKRVSPTEFDEVIEAWARIDRFTRDPGAATVDAGRHGAPKQCLFYLEDAHSEAVCRDDFGSKARRTYGSAMENRFWFLSGVRLKHCCEHAVVNALSPGRGGTLEAVLRGGKDCTRVLDTVVQVDLLAARLQCEFEEVLVRYDCGQTYSVIHNCTHCKEAYRKWVCSSLVPYFAHGGPHDSEPTEESWVARRIRPCRSLCQSVEQRCPYLLPGDRAPAYPTQYAGEPTFLCRDPNIPETGEQAARALHPTSEDECCFNGCRENDPLLGNCANCSNSVVYMGPNPRDPPTAPHCDISPALPGPSPKRSSLCGVTGLGSIQSAIEPPDDELTSPPPTATISTTTTTTTTSTTTAISRLLSSSSSSSSSSSTTSSTSATSVTAVASSSSSSSSSAVATSSSSCVTTPSTSLALVCLFWLWGVLFSSQCSSLLLLTTLYRRVCHSALLALRRVLSSSSESSSSMRSCSRQRNQLLTTSSLSSVRLNHVRTKRRYNCKHFWRHWHWLWPCRWKKRCQPREKRPTRSTSWNREPS